MKFLVEVGYVVHETKVRLHHDSPVMGAYEVEGLGKEEYLCGTKATATRKLNAIKQKYLAEGFRESSSDPNCLFVPYTPGTPASDVEIWLSIKEVELSRQRSKVSVKKQ